MQKLRDVKFPPALKAEAEFNHLKQPLTCELNNPNFHNNQQKSQGSNTRPPIMIGGNLTCEDLIISLKFQLWKLKYT